MLWGDGFEIETLINCRFAAAGVVDRRGAQRRARPHLRQQQPAGRLRRAPGPAHAARPSTPGHVPDRRQRLERTPLWHPDRMGIRVGMIATRCQPEIGGIESHVAEVAGRLVAHGYELEVLTTDRSGDLPQVERDGRGLRHPPLPRLPRVARLVLQPRAVPRRPARRSTTSCTSRACTPLVPPMAMLAALLRRRPYLLTFHTGGNSSAFREKARSTQWRILAPLAAPGEPADRCLRLRGPPIRRGAGLGSRDDHGDPQRRLAAAGRGVGHPGAGPDRQRRPGGALQGPPQGHRGAPAPARRRIPTRTCRCSAPAPTRPSCSPSRSRSAYGTGSSIEFIPRSTGR